jgi:hypothetical protein
MQQSRSLAGCSRVPQFGASGAAGLGTATHTVQEVLPDVKRAGRFPGREYPAEAMGDCLDS